MDAVRDRFWLWAHEAGSHTRPDYYDYGIPGSSRMTPAEAAGYMDIPNVVMVRYHNRPEPPFEQYMKSLASLKTVVWSILGNGSSSTCVDIEEVKRIAARHSNIRGVIMDDFFERTRGADGKAVLAPYTPEELAGFRERLQVEGRRLELWIVQYARLVDAPVTAYLDRCDAVTFWTFCAADLADLESTFERFEKSTRSRKLLGCYMYDYGGRKDMPASLMEKQCGMGLRWLKEGRIEGIIFLASCICDLELEAVEWTRKWIREVGKETV